MEKYTEKIESVQEKIRQLKNRQKLLLKKKSDAERKVRTHRLIERGAILESVFPVLAECSGEQVKAFLRSVERLAEVRKLLPKESNDGDAQ